MPSKTLVWFRRDLRINDNNALSKALKTADQVTAIFILSEEEKLTLGGASKWYLHQSLLSLQIDLKNLNIDLVCEHGDPIKVICRYVEKYQYKEVLFNRVVEPIIEANDSLIKNALKNLTISCRIFDDDCLVMPENGYKADGTPYKVFTPFWNSLQHTIISTDYKERLVTLNQTSSVQLNDKDKTQVESLNLLPNNHWYIKFHQYWSAGESSARHRFQSFLTKQVEHYDINRNFPSLNSTSRLSASLHFGEISVVRIYDECQYFLIHEQSETVRNSIKRFLAEIGWREFARHVLHAHPHSPTHSLNAKFDQYGVWSSEPSEEDLMAWKKGETGIPMIDAGMQELWETGTMHNRVRMLVGSFLTKNLGIHWKEGAKWFWDTLIDADLASNTLGWQWVAGCGTDASPFYRIFNPELQAQKFDSEGKYITRWLNTDLMLNPIVDLKASREDALQRYKMMNQ